MKKLFDEVPHLEGERIILKRITHEDVDGLNELAHSEKVYRYEPTFLFERQYEDMHQMIDDAYGEVFFNKQKLIMGIYWKEDGSFCGIAEFYGYKESIQKTCLGYRLLERWWGKGIASETVSLMIDYAFNQTNIETITASTMIENRGSAHVLEKNGFILTAKEVLEDWGYPEMTKADKWMR